MKDLPDDLATIEPHDLARQRAVRDEHLARLFRRWPKLNRIEMRQLKTIYAERLRIARHIGRLRLRGRS